MLIQKKYKRNIKEIQKKYKDKEMLIQKKCKDREMLIQKRLSSCCLALIGPLSPNTKSGKARRLEKENAIIR